MTGWLQTFPATGYQLVGLNPSQDATGVDFGNFQYVTFSGTVFTDTNLNGILDSGEKGLSGITVSLDNGLRTATTDINGNYSFTLVGPGSHSVSEMLPSNNFLTGPASNLYAIVAQSGSNAAGLNFGNVVPSATRDNGQTGYSEKTAKGTTWTTLNAGWEGTSRLHAADHTGASYAQWVLGAAKGKYEIEVSFVADPSRATNAAYQIFDGTKLIAIVSVNQTIAASGGLYQGVQWVSLGTFTFATKTISVRLSANGNGSVNADGVLLLKAPSSAANAVVLAQPSVASLGTGVDAAVTSNRGTSESLDAVAWQGWLADQLFAATPLGDNGNSGAAITDEVFSAHHQSQIGAEELASLLGEDAVTGKI